VKFLLTQELGRLARWLRILGFDSAYFNQANSSSLIIQALRDERIILSRNHRLPQARGIKIVLLKSETIKEQLAEVFSALRIKPDTRMMFTRCLICNQELQGIEKEKVKAQVPEYVYQTQENFVRCPQCRRIYWQGTHWGNVQNVIAEISS
jgi:uncharacterized protein with PIN domain